MTATATPTAISKKKNMVKMIQIITNPPDMYAKNMKRITVAGLKAGVIYWRDRMAARHFKPGASTRYGYQKRRATYFKRKRADGKGTTPLVYTGFSKNEILMSKRRPKVRTVGGVVTVGMPFNAPKYFFQFRKDLNTPDKKEEFLTLLEVERAKLTEIASEAFEKKMATFKKRVVRDIKKGLV